MHDEKYWNVRTPLGAALDIIGWIPDANLESTKEALEFTDNQVRMFAMGALLRRGTEPDPQLLSQLAATHEIRNNLFYLLKSRNRLDLFPAEFLTLDAFAASEMVEWLSYPAELGEPPAQLALVTRITGDQGGQKKVAYLWRFSDGAGKQYASLSGVYDQQVEIGPVYGDHTFSAFNEWASMSEEDHIKTIFETLDDWSDYALVSAATNPGFGTMPIIPDRENIDPEEERLRLIKIRQQEEEAKIEDAANRLRAAKAVDLAAETKRNRPWWKFW